MAPACRILQLRSDGGATSDRGTRSVRYSQLGETGAVGGGGSSAPRHEGLNVACPGQGEIGTLETTTTVRDSSRI